MKHKFIAFCASFLLIFLISVNLRFSENKGDIDISLKQETMACNIIPEVPEDYCWEIKYYPEYYTCSSGGIWSCYI